MRSLSLLPLQTPLSLTPLSFNQTLITIHHRQTQLNACIFTHLTRCCFTNGSEVIEGGASAALPSSDGCFLSGGIAHISLVEDLQAESGRTDSVLEGADGELSAYEGLELLPTSALPSSPQYAPPQGDLLSFTLFSVFLVVVFWLGNYVIPDMIFRNTVFRREPLDKPDNLDLFDEEF